MTSSLESVKHKQAAILAIVGGFPGMAAYMQDLRVLQLENGQLREKLVV